MLTAHLLERNFKLNAIVYLFLPFYGLTKALYGLTKTRVIRSLSPMALYGARPASSFAAR